MHTLINYNTQQTCVYNLRIYAGCLFVCVLTNNLINNMFVTDLLHIHNMYLCIYEVLYSFLLNNKLATIK